MSNYPDGVSDSHPYFNPAPVSASAVECGADSALVLPAHAVKVTLDELQAYIARLAKMAKDGDMLWAAETLDTIWNWTHAKREALQPLVQEREYECPFKDEVDLEESECARWDYPVCGNERETDNAPDERDPDEEWERRNER
jgi:hypothetical protein